MQFLVLVVDLCIVRNYQQLTIWANLISSDFIYMNNHVVTITAQKAIVYKFLAYQNTENYYLKLGENCLRI